MHTYVRGSSVRREAARTAKQYVKWISFPERWSEDIFSKSHFATDIFLTTLGHFRMASSKHTLRHFFDNLS